MSLPTIGAGLLVAGGFINALQPVSNKLTHIFGGKPVLQVVVGVVSVVVGFTLISQGL